MSDEVDDITECTSLLNPSISKPKHGKLMINSFSWLIKVEMMIFMLHIPY